TAIYSQIKNWIDAGSVKIVLSEGCSGVIDASFTSVYNGWSYKDLVKEVNQPGYERLVSLIPLKIEAKYTSKVETICIDDEVLLREQGLAMSDARGSTGYLARLIQYANDPIKVKPYLEQVIEMNKLAKNSTVQTAIASMKKDL